MFDAIRRPFGYEPVLTKEDLKKSPDKKNERAKNWKSTLLRIWKLVDEQRTLLIIVLALVFISSAMALLGPFLIGYIIDTYIVPGAFEGMGLIIGWLIVVYVLHSVSLYLQNYWMVGIAQQVIYQMRAGLFGHLQRLPVSFFDKRQHGELMSRVTNDIENVSSTLNTSFIQVFSSILTLVGTAVVMVMLSPMLTILTFIIIPLMYVSVRWITKRTGRLYKEQQKAVGDLNGMIEETISGQKIVKAFSQEDRVMDDFLEKSERLRRTGFWAWTYAGFIPKVMNFLNNGSFALVAGVGGLLALNGSVTIGVIVIFTEYSRQFTRPLNDLANQFNTVLSAIAGAERVFAIMDEAEEADDTKRNADKRLDGKVEFDKVSFKYEGAEEEWTIRDLSFTVETGQTAAFVGATGAGKTTVMQLLARFYDVNEGEIRIDGTPIGAMPRETLRKQIAFVLQDPFLFEATVSDNIRYGKLDASDEEVVEAAKQANAHEFISKLPEGYDTVLSGDGSMISQGQKQLLSIARALIADPVILLLDEATSSIDTVTELKIQEALERLMEGRTSFVIAHRLNTVRKADSVYVMELGKLVEAGSQDELLNKGGLYATMLTDAKL
ncbi:ABC transporter ATP-binding protein [Planococcus maritimus]|uniref:ABC transporter ATP-binding protein n=1 Tax=Planococcus maritimus TaxID=192421 RepID=A0A7D7QZT5_PLAMR|nr:ABC transporter ATP-binding protein [Planococcus maritimus]KYG59662.1 multidrug ABC transporter ATP-binding protein [Planococcus maritimus]QMT16996.1 ABC transporter ATP-binding protein [Planococcus maritimus]